MHVQIDIDQGPLCQLAAQLRAAVRVMPARRQRAVDLLQPIDRPLPARARAALLARGVCLGHGARGILVVRWREQRVFAREVALHQLRGLRRARRTRVQAPEERLDEAPGHQRQQQTLARRVKRANVERARVAQRRVGRARSERFVHVHEIQRHAAQQFLERARHVDRQRRRAPTRGVGRHVEHLADRDHRRHARVGPLQQRANAARPRARRTQRPSRGAHPLLRARRRQHQHAVPTPRQPLGQRAHLGVDPVLLRLPRVRSDVGDREPLCGGHRCAHCYAPAQRRARVAGETPLALGRVPGLPA